MPSLRSQLRWYYQSLIRPRDPGDVIAGRVGAATVGRDLPVPERRRWWQQPAVIAIGAAAAALVLIGGTALLTLQFAGGGPADHTVPVTVPVTTTILSTTTTPVTSTTGAVGAECPPGSNPDLPGPVDQERPTGLDQGSPAMAFDAESGVIVTVLGRATWTFDVCVNTWQQRVRAPIRVHRLVYLPGEDLTVAFEVPGDGSSVWAYEVEADGWQELPDLPASAYAAALDPGSGRLVAGDVGSLWALDLEAEAWTQLPLTGEAPCAASCINGFGGVQLMEYDPGVPGFVVYTDQPVSEATGTGTVRTFLLDPSGEFTAIQTTTPNVAFGWVPTGNEIVYDGATGRVAIYSGGRLIEYDVAAGEWVTVWDQAEDAPDLTATYRLYHAVVYDSLNRRLVIYGGDAREPNQEWRPGDDVWAFDPIAGEWLPLLDRPESG